jgi:quinol monooxygenase YgiN
MAYLQNNHSEMGKVRSTIRMLIPLEKQGEALEILKAICAQIQFEPRCISSQLYRSVDEERVIMLEEFWESDQDILHHLKSDAYHRILMVIEMAEEPPDIRFDTISLSAGIEVIEKARNKG